MISANICFYTSGLRKIQKNLFFFFSFEIFLISFLHTFSSPFACQLLVPVCLHSHQFFVDWICRWLRLLNISKILFFSLTHRIWFSMISFQFRCNFLDLILNYCCCNWIAFVWHEQLGNTLWMRLKTKPMMMMMMTMQHRQQHYWWPNSMLEQHCYRLSPNKIVLDC